MKQIAYIHLIQYPTHLALPEREALRQEGEVRSSGLKVSIIFSNLFSKINRGSVESVPMLGVGVLVFGS